MNTYIQTPDLSTAYAAVRASRAELARAGYAALVVPATKRLRRDAHIGAIPTLCVLRDGKLGRL